MALTDLTDWLDEFGRPGATWYAKRLSGNDTLANESHQAGPYVPRELLFEVLPELNRPETENPEHLFDLFIDSHADVRRVRAVWYNNRLRGGTRNETRLTGFGGISSPLLDPDNTGELSVFVFVRPDNQTPVECHVWVCGGEGTEADLVEERLGPVEPKQMVIWRPGALPDQSELFTPAAAPKRSCWLEPSEIPRPWLTRFPSGLQIIEKTIDLRPLTAADVDARLIKRRACEFELFRSVEEAFWMPRISEGFPSIEAFLGMANSVLQSRKSRAGKSLEYHALRLFEEEGFRATDDFDHNVVIEGGKRPDFLFPNAAAYADDAFPSARLRMMAAKTTCKDRWRQILNEADRIPVKHLLTLQEGVSISQFSEMREAGVRLVVPKGLHDAYPERVRPELMTLEEFIGDLRLVRLRMA